ncbi:lipid-A-disaccharide synthase [Methylotetracoccus oryzae]|uniref:lipid-A-disaccharide synthase n=1 Tax=Methylotetracoccus oryzae TaxID=1919059 RepID=UPI002E25BBE3
MHAVEGALHAGDTPGDSGRERPLVMLVAGEASGDRHAADSFRELRRLIPDVRGIGMGGPAMREAGVEIVQDSAGMAVIGVVEVIRHYRHIRRVLKKMQTLVCERRPDLLICVDYKEFNFHLARAAKACGVRVLFYVGPQFWAWRPGRVKTYGQAVSHMAVIFPFEVPHYQAAGVPVTYVGHPLAGKVAPRMTRAWALTRFGFGKGGPIVGLLPGSRANEIRRLLPVMLESARQLAERVPGVRFVLAEAPSVESSLIEEALAQHGLPLRRVPGLDYDLLQCCDAVVTSSGTATLELALLKVPMVIIYRLSPVTYWLGRLLVKIPFIGLPNILAGRSVVREFIQHDANPEKIVAELEHILSDTPYAASMRAALSEVAGILGAGGGSANLARLAAELLSGGGSPSSGKSSIEDK